MEFSGPIVSARFFRILIVSGIIMAGSWLADARAAMHADSLLPNTSHPVGKPLNKTDVSEGGGKWVATQDITITENGATANAPAGAHLSIPMIAGRIRIEADVSAKGSGFTALVLGGANLSHNFWQDVAIMLTVTGDGHYNVFAANKNLISAPDKSLLHAEGSNHLELIVDTIARTFTIRINGKTALEDGPLPKEAQLDKTTSAGFRFNEPVIAGQPTVSNFRVETNSLAATGLELIDVGMCFVLPDKESTLRWRVASPGPTKQIAYVIHDYWGHPIDKGNAIQEDDSTVNLTRTFSRGYAEIVFPGAGQTFGIVALEPQPAPADSFFCIDAGLSWLELNSEKRAALVKIAARCGITMTRERLGLGAVNPAKGKFDFESPRHFDSMRKMYADSNLPILEILDGGAQYLHTTHSAFPDNLPDMTAAWVEVAKHWKIWGGAEVFNEPDLKTVPADQYVPMVKSISYALAEAQSQVPLVAGVFATMPPGPYFDTCQANGMLDDANVVGFHSYDRAPDVESMIARYRTWLKNAGKEALPLWHTECGWSWTLGPARPPQDQDALSALEISTKAVETMACGVAKYFPFVYVYYEEGKKNFGMMGREATPLRSMAAYAMCIQTLSGKKYIGDLTGLDGSIKMSRVFANAAGNECVAVLYTGRLDPLARISFPIKVKRVAGADGRSLQVSDQGLPIPDGMAYVWMDTADVQATLKTDTFAKRLYELGQHPLVQKRHAAPLVLQFLDQQTPFRASARRYLATQALAHDMPLNVRVHNLSQSPIVFTPELTLPGKAGEKAAPVTVPAMGYSDVAWKLNVAPQLDLAQTRFISISGTSESGIQPLPLALPVIIEGTLEQHLQTHKKQMPLKITDLRNWKPNIAGHGKSSFSIPGDGVWRMDVKFSGSGGNWSYPKFVLSEKLDTDVYSGFLIRARIVKSASGIAVIAGSGGAACSFWVSDLFPADGEWHVSYVPFAEFKPGPGGAGNQNTRLDPALWKDISIGMGSEGSENAIEISHFIVVGGNGE